MLHHWRRACSLLACYFVSLGFVLYAVDVFGLLPAQAQTLPDCPCCRAEWVGQMRLIGALECQHGPENDPIGCPPLEQVVSSVDCWEVNGGVPSPKTDKKCECYKCYGDGGCEEEIQRWYAWCTTATGQRCDVEADEPGPNYRYRFTTVPGGAACAYQANPPSGFIPVPYCGTGTGGGPSGGRLGCKNTNGCTDAGNPWWYNPDGPRQKCS